MIFLPILLAAAALFLLWFANRQRRASGLPSGKVISSDTGTGIQLEKPLYDPQSGLTGRPDYLIEQEGGKMLIPVEVKSARAPSTPYDSHVYQLAAYCLLVQRVYGIRPTHGILKYRDRSYVIDYTTLLEQEVIALAQAMRAEVARSARKTSRSASSGLERSHEEPGRCARCGYRNSCDQRL